MVGILLMTHAPLGQAFVAAVAHVFRGPTEHFEAIDVSADQDLAEVNELARQAICRLDDGSGVLVITDIKGGTPANCCNCLADAGHVEVIAGISLPMLLRAITYRRDTLDVVVEMALAGAQSGAVRVDNRIRVGPT
ncbi:PTS sugar transporter subunit IIA [Massilia genomosp. 1]|uniref:PTS fructose transporter subunit IIA n=1 Tax=Massilia genomosp. 1 TaxID=2609280 RepID=A0ABX0MLI8_9BURK|nr:PTS fructose transporter subunit IIA [Massilia genomosp. 1]NHZ60858.1 PTS fructose transporter subunit IIA [Massilia genomosp. 1]